MKKHVTWLAALALASVVGGYAATRCWFCQQERSDMERIQDVSILTRALELRPDQVETIGARQKGLCSNLMVCCARYCGCRSDLASALVADPFDPQRVRELQEALCQAYADSEMATLKHVRGIRDVLDARQRATFDRMIKEAMGKPCGLCKKCGAACSGGAR